MSQTDGNDIEESGRNPEDSKDVSIDTEADDGGAPAPNTKGATPSRQPRPQPKRGRRVTRTPASGPGANLAELWADAGKRVGGTVQVTFKQLAQDWGVVVSTVSERLGHYETRGLITRETLKGNQGSRLTFLRPPTDDELAEQVRITTQRSPNTPKASSQRSPNTLLNTLRRSAQPPANTPDAFGERQPNTPANTRDRSQSNASQGVRRQPKISRIQDVAAQVRVFAEHPRQVSGEHPSSPAGKIVVFPGTATSALRLPVLPNTSPEETARSPNALSYESQGSANTLPNTSEPAPPNTLASQFRFWPRRPHPIPLPFFRPSHALRLVSAAAVAVSIAMIAYHSAGSSAESAFHWWATLAMAIILSTGKVVLGSQAEGFFADGEKGAGIFCVIGAVFLLCVDASLLYAFRGDSLSNAAAMEKAAMESRQRVQTRLDGLLAEQKRLIAFQADPALVPAAESADAKPIRLVGEVEADLAALEHDRDCRLIQPRARRGQPQPPKVPANEAACEKKRAALQGELARAEDAVRSQTRDQVAAEKREKRLAELPAQIAGVEAELAKTQARATPDHGASIVARGLNWVPAGISDVIWGAEMRPVEGRGVEIFWSWAFVLAAEMFAVGGFAVAARADRRARDRRRREMLGEAA